MDTINDRLVVAEPPAPPTRQPVKCWCGWPAMHTATVNDQPVRLCWQHYDRVVNRWDGWRR
jgi:hypothetical protein